MKTLFRATLDRIIDRFTRPGARKIPGTHGTRDAPCGLGANLAVERLLSDALLELTVALHELVAHLHLPNER